ncbi:MAG TPA: thioredoxin domain-containing protein [Candidatus Paceibacterota bacterium]|nr:thioredoxin domain-containing protein [Candidatus Paceibacterota bacterium]
MDSPEQTSIRTREAWFIPAAIIAAGFILALAIYMQRHTSVEGSVKADISLLHPVSLSDHIIGSPSAPVKLVEYSDIDSSYSKTFQQTMEQLMAQYASGGQVAWVYRHLPLIDQHLYAAEHAEAAECIASLGGSGIFWRFIDSLNSAAPGNVQFDPANYDSVVSSLGILPQSFNACMTAHTYQQKVSSDFQNGIAIGAEGSPFTVLLVKGQPPITLNGAVPYDGLKKIVDQAIEKALEATSTPSK